MADNETTKDKAPASTQTQPPAASAKGKETEVTETIVIETSTFDPTKRELLDQAEDAFRANVAESYGKGTLTNVELVKVNHRVGHQAEYHYRGKLTV